MICDYKEQTENTSMSLGHSHSYYEMIIFEKGNVEFFVKNIAYECLPGDIILINEYCPHKLIHHSDSYVRYVLMFKPEEVLPILKLFDAEGLLDFVFRRDCVHYNLNHSILYSLKELINELIPMNTDYTQLLKYNVAHYSPIVKLMDILLLISKSLQHDSPQYKFNRTDEMIKNIISFIEVNYSKTFTLDGLAKQFNISKYHLSRIFYKKTGYNLFEFISLQKVINAKQLLRDTKLSIHEIVYRCGFHSEQEFFRKFKQFENVTPNRYRKSSHKLIDY